MKQDTTYSRASNHDILTIYYGFIVDTCKKITRNSNAYEDLANDIYLYLFWKENEWLNRLHTEDTLRYYIFKAISIQAYSKNSYHTKMYSNVLMSSDDDTIEFNVNKINELSDEEINILSIFVACGSVNQVEEVYGLDHKKIKVLINNIKKKLI